LQVSGLVGIVARGPALASAIGGDAWTTLDGAFTQLADLEYLRRANATVDDEEPLLADKTSVARPARRATRWRFVQSDRGQEFAVGDVAALALGPLAGAVVCVLPCGKLARQHVENRHRAARRVALAVLLALDVVEAALDADAPTSPVDIRPTQRAELAGASERRHMFGEVAWNPLPHPGPLHAFFDRVRARRGRQIAATATARKLVVLFGYLLAREQDHAFGRRGASSRRGRRSPPRQRLAGHRTGEAGAGATPRISKALEGQGRAAANQPQNLRFASSVARTQRRPSREDTTSAT
jgi:hypothetical protein